MKDASGPIPDCALHTPRWTDVLQTRRCAFVVGAIFCVVAAVAGLWFGRLFFSASSKSDLCVVGVEWVEFDVMDRSRPASWTFTLKNVGRRTVTILDYQSDCGCSTIKMDRVEVPPGSETTAKFAIHQFDDEADSYSQYVQLNTSQGPIQLGMRGRLPPSRTIKYRPTTISLSRNRAAGEWNENRAEIVLRVPVAMSFRKAVAGGDSSIRVAVEKGRAGTRTTAEHVVRVSTERGAKCDGRPDHLAVEFDGQTVEVPISLIDGE